MDVLEQPGESLDSGAADIPAAGHQAGAGDNEDDQSVLVEDLNPEGQTSDPPEELEEVELDGHKFQLPKSAAKRFHDERLMQQDYTRKTQEVADQRKQLASEREQVQRAAQVNEQYLQTRAEVVAIDKQLAQFKDLNWSQLVANAPQEAQLLQIQFQELTQARQQAASNLTRIEQDRALNEQQSFAKQIQDAAAYVQREITGFSSDRDNQIETYLRSRGVDGHAMAQVVARIPEVLVLAHKAELYDALMKKQAPPQKPAQTAKAPTPAAKVNATAPAKKDPSQMTDAEFAAYRKRVSSRKR